MARPAHAPGAGHPFGPLGLEFFSARQPGGYTPAPGPNGNARPPFLEHPPLEHLIATYGYWAVGIGTFLEGETILVLGGFSAHRGYLDLPWVILWAFLGTVAGDQFYFYVGRIKGRALLDRRPAWKAKSERVFRLLDRHQTWLILGFRFLYGLRTVTPFLIGTGNIPPLRFLALNALGGALWAVCFGTAGYLFGQVLETILGDIKRYEVGILALLGVAGAVVWAVYFLKARKAGQGR
ncbi:MAG: DedA family protein [Rhodobacterales bacterium]|nr:DedA family protein [Rhodobacterales bacterium]